MQRKECCPFLVSRCLAYSDDPRWSSCRLFPTTHADLSPLALSFMAVMLLRPLWILVLASLFSAAGKYNVKLKQTSYNYMYWSAVRCSLPAGPVDDDFRSPLLALSRHKRNVSRDRKYKLRSWPSVYDVMIGSSSVLFVKWSAFLHAKIDIQQKHN